MHQSRSSLVSLLGHESRHLGEQLLSMLSAVPWFGYLIARRLPAQCIFKGVLETPRVCLLCVMNEHVSRVPRLWLTKHSSVSRAVLRLRIPDPMPYGDFVCVPLV